MNEGTLPVARVRPDRSRPSKALRLHHWARQSWQSCAPLPKAEAPARRWQRPAKASDISRPTRRSHWKRRQTWRHR